MDCQQVYTQKHNIKKSKYDKSGYWTLELCKIDASRFKSRKAWSKGSSGAYTRAAKNGWIDECCGHMCRPRNLKWTLELCIDEAKKHGSRRDWAKNGSGSYKAARREGWYSECCRHIEVLPFGGYKWSEYACMDDASKYTYRSDWHNASASAVAAAVKLGIYEKCCAHMVRKIAKRGSWTLKKCIESAKQYTYAKAWRKYNPGAYTAAYRFGWLEKCCSHMEFRPKSDDDVLYIWKAPREHYNGNPVYKIGVTSKRLGKKRIFELNNDAKIIAIVNVIGSARLHEQRLLEIGENPKYIEGNGKTEYRAMSDSDLRMALDYIEFNVVKG